MEWRFPFYRLPFSDSRFRVFALLRAALFAIPFEFVANDWVQKDIVRKIMI